MFVLRYLLSFVVSTIGGIGVLQGFYLASRLRLALELFLSALEALHVINAVKTYFRICCIQQGKHLVSLGTCRHHLETSLAQQIAHPFHSPAYNRNLG